jgi:hypothetical protein
MKESGKKTECKREHRSRKLFCESAEKYFGRRWEGVEAHGERKRGWEGTGD